MAIEQASNSLTGSKGKRWSPLDSAAGPGGDSPLKNTGDGKKRKLGTEGMSYKEKMAYYKKQSSNTKKQGQQGKSISVRSGVGTANQKTHAKATGVSRGKNKEANVGGLRIKAKF